VIVVIIVIVVKAVGTVYLTRLATQAKEGHTVKPFRLCDLPPGHRLRLA